MSGKCPSLQYEIAVEPHDERELRHFARLCRLQHGLTRRQSEVLYALVRGHTFRPYLARELRITRGALSWDIGNIYRRLGIDAANGAASPLLVMRVWRQLLHARALVGAGRMEAGGHAVVDGGGTGRDVGAGARRLGGVGADGALWAAGVPSADGRMGAGGEST